MTRSALAAIALGILLATPSMPAEAQGVRGLIKKKVAEAVKPAEQAKAEEMPAALQQSNVVPISDVSLEHFKRGLEVEIAERAALTKFLASIKTREQYQACSSGVAMSPEGQKIVMSMGDMPENATAEQMQAAMTKMNERITALVVKTCGEDPQQYAGKWRVDRLREIEAKAAAAAGPASGSDEGSWSSLAPTGPDGGSAELTTSLAIVDFAGMTREQYALLKERAISFCQAIKNGWVPPNTPIVKMPGAGMGVWVFTQDEVQALLKQCETLMPLLLQVT
jgi:hypothetical protein